MKKILLMLAAACGLLGAVADDSAVAKVGDVEYTRFDEAMLAAIKQGEATVTILRDFKYAGQYTTNKFVGAGADVTKITIVNDYKVNFRTWTPGYGMILDGLTLTLKGSGTWWKDAEGENIGHTNATMFVVGEKSAAANVIVESGTFYATDPKCLFNVQLGTITINGGTFQKVNSNEGGTQGWCVRAEKSEVDTTTGGVVIINGGTFEGPSDGQNAFIGPKSGSENYATIRINVAGDIKLKGSTAALTDMKQYLVVTNADGTYTAASDYEFVRKGADGYYAAVATGTAVAKIGDISYAEFDTALQDAIAAGEATVTVLKNIDLTSAILLVGQGTDKTKITIENNYTVDFKTIDDRAFHVDGLTLTLKGTGTWKKTDTSASMFLAGEKSAAADIIVESGNFYAMYSSCIFNVQLGSITVNGGTFKTDNTSGKCVRAEKSDVAEANPDQFVDKAKAGVVIINGGSFEGPSNGTAGLIMIRNEESVAAGAEVWINVEGDITLKGSETAIEQTSQYFRIKGTDEDGAITYTETEDYKFADKDEDGVYTICEIDWATLTINFDEAAVQKVTVTSADDSAEYTLTKAQYKCDKDDAEELTLAVTCKDGYELDMTEDALKVTMDQDRTVTIVTKASGGATYAAVEAGSTTACATAADATAMAAAINANKANLIKAPGNIVLTGDDLSTYAALFEATASGTDVTVALTADAESALQKVVDEATVNFVMGESAAVFTVTNAVPGLYYVLYSGVEKPTDLSTKDVVQATSGKVEFNFEKGEYKQAFFKVEACVTAPVQ